MDANDIIELFNAVNDDPAFGESLTLDDAQNILMHMPSPDMVPEKAFSEDYWIFISTEPEVLKDLVLDCVNSESDAEDLDFVEDLEDWEDYVDDAIEQVCEENDMVLIGSEDTIVLVSNFLIKQGYITEQPARWQETLDNLHVSE